MTDGPFKGMAPDPEFTGRDLSKPVECPICGGVYFSGDWPFCKGKVSDHER